MESCIIVINNGNFNLCYLNKYINYNFRLGMGIVVECNVVLVILLEMVVSNNGVNFYLVVMGLDKLVCFSIL